MSFALRFGISDPFGPLGTLGEGPLDGTNSDSEATSHVVVDSSVVLHQLMTSQVTPTRAQLMVILSAVRVTGLSGASHLK